MKFSYLTQFILVLFSCSLMVACTTLNKSDTPVKPINKYNLSFDETKFEVQELIYAGKKITFRAYEQIVYVQYPIDTIYQVMNIYIPTEYFEGKNVAGYTAQTAPIFFPNRVGGYMQSLPSFAIPKIEKSDRPIEPGGNHPNSIAAALSKGLVVASAGARGRTTQSSTGSYIGKAPSVIIDLKAAIRYLKYNDKNMPGDAEKIISNGTSAGGAVSVLLGATGNNPDYESYLKALGAANTKDDIFAVSAYCPITNLDFSDSAYEWQFNKVLDYKGRRTSGTLSQKEVELSNQLKKLFPSYLNSLQLKTKAGELLHLNEDGDGNFTNLVKSYIIASAQKAFDAGKDLSIYPWITWNGNKVIDIDFQAFIRYMGRMKTPPAFDALDLNSPENQLFGSEQVDKKHFTDFATQNSTANGTKAAVTQVKMMNPMYYIGNAKTNPAKHWRIRHGLKDSDTSLAISVLLTTLLENKGYPVDLELPWDIPHSGDYDLEDLFSWIAQVCK